MGCSTNATSIAAGRDTRGWLTYPDGRSTSVRPIGNSSRLRPSTLRTTARLAPSAAQSAACTASRTSRGPPPASVERASVPMVTNGPAGRAASEIAISPAGGDREDVGGRERQRHGLRDLGPRRVHPDGPSAPRGAVDDRLPVGGDTGRPDCSVAVREPAEGRLHRAPREAPPKTYAEATSAATASATPAGQPGARGPAPGRRQERRRLALDLREVIAHALRGRARGRASRHSAPRGASRGIARRSSAAAPERAVRSTRSARPRRG